MSSILFGFNNLVIVFIYSLGHRSWQKFIHNSLQNLNLTSLDFDINKINQLLTDQHSKVILNKLQHLSTQEQNKLFFFASIISIQKILFYKIIFH